MPTKQTKPTETFYRCREPFMFTDKHGLPHFARFGDVVTSRDPAYRAGPQHWAPVTDVAGTGAQAATERATAAPGEKRANPRVSAATLVTEEAPESSPGEPVGDDGVE